MGVYIIARVQNIHVRAMEELLEVVQILRNYRS